MELYGYDFENMDAALENFFSRNPNYDLTKDPQLNGPGTATASSLVMRMECDAGSLSSCFAWSMLLSIPVWGDFLRNAAPVAENPEPSYGADGLGNPDCAGCGYSAATTTLDYIKATGKPFNGQGRAGNFPKTSDSPFLYKTDQSGNVYSYASYDSSGKATLRVDLTGSHGTIQGPHVHTASWNSGQFNGFHGSVYPVQPTFPYPR